MRVTPIKLAAITFASVAVISGCASQPKQDAVKQDHAVVIPAPQSYRNSTVQYTLTYPESWHSRVQPQDTNVWQGRALMDAENVVVFNYVEIDNGNQAKPLLALATYDKATYERLTSAVGVERPSGQIIAARGNKVLVVYQSTTNPYDPVSFQGQQYARRLVSKDVLKSNLTW